MKKIAVILLGLVMSSALFAQEAQNNFYAAAGVGIEAMPKKYDNGLGLSLKGGAILNEVMPNFGLEGELTTSLVSPKSPGGGDINIFTLGAYATYTIQIPNSAFSLRPKFGFILPNLSDNIDSYDFRVSSGLAALMKINNQIHVYIEYENESEAMNNYLVGLEMHF
jgi:hypothetical protein